MINPRTAENALRGFLLGLNEGNLSVILHLGQTHNNCGLIIFFNVAY